MFDIGADELLLTAVVAIVVIGPKDLPRALRTAGRWIAKMRRMSNAFRAGIENVIREAEMEELERTWREQNAAIMAEHPHIPADQHPHELPAGPAASPEHPSAAAAEQGDVAHPPAPPVVPPTAPDARPVSTAQPPVSEADH